MTQPGTGPKKERELLRRFNLRAESAGHSHEQWWLKKKEVTQGAREKRSADCQERMEERVAAMG